MQVVTGKQHLSLKCATPQKARQLERTLKEGDGDRVEPGRFHLDCHQKVVPVHEGVDPKIHGNKNNAEGGRVAKAMPAVQEYSNMVVPVQEHELLLVDNDEKSIQKFAVTMFKGTRVP